MLNISMIRVDERLIHGQITIKWVEVKGVNHILVIDNEIAKNPIIEKILKMSVPQEVNLGIYNVEEGTKVITTTNSSDNVLVLVKHLWIIKFMHKKGVEIKEVNIGRIPSGFGKKKVYPGVFLSNEDIEIINYFESKDIPVIIQVVPDSFPIKVYDLI